MIEADRCMQPGPMQIEFEKEILKNSLFKYYYTQVTLKSLQSDWRLALESQEIFQQSWKKKKKNPDKKCDTRKKRSINKKQIEL